MSQPTVCAVMLTADRPDLANRAVECFRSQTYPAKRLLIMDSGLELVFSPVDSTEQIGIIDARGVRGFRNARGVRGFTIGELRNLAASGIEPDIIIHWDDDDWSHPNRIAEQVAMLQSSGADAVGYREMLFWRQNQDGMDALSEAWLYSNRSPTYCLGTSLCYWRKTWESKPFAATSRGEDSQWQIGLKTVAVSSVGVSESEEDFARVAQPRMIARIHGSNTSSAYDPERMANEAKKTNPMWRRVPEWDRYCREVMER